MNYSKARSFKKVTDRPRWEGIILTELDFGDPRISISAIEPQDSLKPYIESIWCMKWEIEDNQSLRTVLAPNPCPKLVVLQQNEQTFPVVVVGARSKGSLVELRGCASTIGFDFKPGGLFAIFEKSMKLWPESGLKVDEMVKDFPQCPQSTWTELSLLNWADEVEDFFIKKLNTPRKNNYQKILSLVDGAMNGLFENSEDMAKSAGMSPRTLQRVFEEEVGLSPRDFLRITRFNQAIRKISQEDFKSLADTALESGFFDQPHMANEFQKLASASPSQFRRYL